MFTGYIKDIGVVTNILQKSSKNLEITVKPRNLETLSDLEVGSSIAVNGVCLSITKKNSETFQAHVGINTFSSTNLKYLRVGDVVNLEPPLTLSSRLDGHIVQGHVDTIGIITKLYKTEEDYVLHVEVKDSTKNFSELVIEKGSIAIDGISLTVQNILPPTSIQIMIIPETFSKTNLKYRKVGDIVNIEYDIIGKYIRKIVKEGDRKDLWKILENGYM